MVVVFPNSIHQSNIDMGIEQKALAHFGRIQHYLGMDFVHGLSSASGINTDMSDRYLLPMARNTVTGQTVKTQDLAGNRFTMSQRTLAEDMARQLADKMTARTGDSWQGFLREYTPTYRR